jgi:KaiC/GvpD/RAD55 family RecA-like ATPase
MALYMHKQFCRAVHQLTAKEQAAIKGTIADYIKNPKLPGLHWHRLDKCKDSSFASIRSSLDIRIILHPCLDGEIICYVDHHNDAYAWAEKRTLTFDEKTGEVLLYEWPVQDRCLFAKPRAERKLPLFQNISDGDLRWYGVSDEWIAEVRRITDENQIYDLANKLPERAWDALLTLAEGKRPSVEKVPRREVIKIESAAEVGKIIDMSWDEWSIFLHPSQEKIVADDGDDDLLVTGGPGTGKTVVALHRAARMSKKLQDGKVLLTMSSCALASRLRQQIKLLDVDLSRCEILTLREVAQKFAQLDIKHIISRADYDDLVRLVASETFHDEDGAYGLDELRDEYAEFWETRHLSREAYLVVDRSKCAFSLNTRQRRSMYSFMEALSKALHELSYCTEYSSFLNTAKEVSPNEYREIIIDECQNLSFAEFQFIQAVREASKFSPRICFLGDSNQRIAGSGDVPSVRRVELSINYRSSELVDRRASKMLGLGATSQSKYRGISPILHRANSEENERAYVCETLKEIRKANPSLRLSDIAFFVHDEKVVSRAEDILEECKIPYVSFYDGAEFGEREIDAVTIVTFNQAPGLEYHVVFVIGCEDGIVPPRDIENTDYERRLLYVVMTRARDVLIVTGVHNLSGFLTQTQEAVFRQDRLTSWVEYFSKAKENVLPRRPRTAEVKEPQKIEKPLAVEEPPMPAGPSNSEIAAKYMTALYHMANIDNIQSLLELGLLPKNEVARRGLAFTNISNASVQARRDMKCDSQYGRNLHDYASLYINPRNAMLKCVLRGRPHSIYILEIGLDVLNEASFVFTNANAAANRSRFYKNIRDLDELNWDIIRSEDCYGPEKFWMQQVQAEFLINPEVMAKFITGVLCRDEASLERLRKTVHTNVELKCAPEMFF